MKKIIAPLLLVVVGVAVAGISLFQASVVGTITKMGLLGQEGTEIFDHNGLVREIESDKWWKCESRVELVGSLAYYLSFGQKKIEMGWKLGEERIKCGAAQIAQGDDMSGAYKIIRGAAYWEKSLVLTEQAGGGCESLTKSQVIKRLAKLKELSNGSTKVELGRILDKLSERIAYETERCIDQGGARE